MSVAARLGAFAIAALVTLGAGYALGTVVGPVDEPAPAPRHAPAHTTPTTTVHSGHGMSR